MTESLYSRVGGEMAIMVASERLYEHLLADELTRPYFQGVDMAAQSRKMVAFLAWAFGGPSEYRGRPLRQAHAGLVAEHGLSDTHFDAVAGHLQRVLRELELDDPTVAEVLGRLEGLRAEVLGR